MNKTVIETVRLILSSMTGDEVDNFDDTAESVQVTDILETTFYDVLTELHIQTNESLITSTTNGNNSVTLPATAIVVDNIRYDISDDATPQYELLTPITWESFLHQQSLLKGLNETEVNTITVSGGTLDVICRTDVRPHYYTVHGHNTVIFDSYDIDIDASGIDTSKLLVYGETLPTFTRSNSFVIPVPTGSWSYYFNKAKARAFVEIEQQDNPDARMQTRESKIMTQLKLPRAKLESDYDKATKFGKTY